MLIQTISKDEYLQESINNILNSIPLNTWEVNFSVDVCIGDSETVGFEIAFHDEDVVENEIYGFKTNQMDINVMGVIRKKNIEYIDFSYMVKSDDVKRESIKCVLLASDDKEDVYKNIRRILMNGDEKNGVYYNRNEYALLRAEMKKIRALGYSDYILTSMKEVVEWCDFETDASELSFYGSTVTGKDLSGLLFGEKELDYLLIEDENWGSINIKGFDDKVRRGIWKLYFEYISTANRDEYSPEIHDFIIRTTNYSCAEYGHELERIMAVLKVLTQDGIKEFKVEAMYCHECNEYYISENEFARIKRYGTLCHKVVTENELLKVKNTYKSWSDKSLLSSYGYSANEQDDLSDAERQRILAFVIENNIANVNRVLSFLEWLVRKRGARCYKACEKWERDIMFVKNYKPVGRYVIAGDIYETNLIPPR